jgi:hypothetical protein
MAKEHKETKKKKKSQWNRDNTNQKESEEIQND